MKGWHSRGYLPHFDGGEILQFISLHLGDALPVAVIKRWKDELRVLEDEEAKERMFWRVERYIDQGFGACYLRRPDVARLVQDALKHFHDIRYRLISWVIMPNHVHFLLRPCEGIELEDIMHSIKSYTAQKANLILGRRGKFWQEDYFDRYIRNYEHLVRTIDYIELNPVKAGLCRRAAEWRYSSAFRESS